MKSDEIKKLLKSGDVAGAQAAARDWLSREPDHAEAKMLYGTCCHLLGDDKTFGEIHEELAPQMVQETDSARLSLWQRYHKIWLGLIIGGLVLAGAAGGVWLFGAGILGMFGEREERYLLYAGPPDISCQLYAAPPEEAIRKVGVPLNDRWIDSETDHDRPSRFAP